MSCAADDAKAPEPAQADDADLVARADLPVAQRRFAAGADAVQTFEAKAAVLLAQVEARRALSPSLLFDGA